MSIVERDWENVGAAPYKGSTAMFRLEVPGGWLVLVCYGPYVSLTFYPDPEHKWNP